MCRMDLSLLQDYIDGTIDPLERVILEEHLGVCQDCRKELNRLKIIDWDLKKYFSDDQAVPVPDELAVLRDASISLFLSEERESAPQVTEEDRGKVGFKDVLSLQVSNLNNSLRYINILTGFNREEKTGRKASQKKKSLFRKIIGM